MKVMYIISITIITSIIISSSNSSSSVDGNSTNSRKQWKVI